MAKSLNVCLPRKGESKWPCGHPIQRHSFRIAHGPKATQKTHHSAAYTRHCDETQDMHCGVVME